MREVGGKSLRFILLFFSLLLYALPVQSKTPKDGSPSQQSATGVKAQSTQEVTTLELGKPVQRGLASQQKHAYQLKLTESQYIIIVVAPRGINVVARLLGTDGTLIAETTSSNWMPGQVRIEQLVETTGNYRLNVETEERRAFAGHYEILATELDTSLENKRALNEAIKLDQEYDKLFWAGKTDEALALANRILAIREAVLGPKHPDIADSLHKVAASYRWNNDNKNAELLHQRALAIRENALGPDHPDVALSLNLLGGYYHEIADYPRVEPLLQRAQEIWEKSFGADSLEAAKGLLRLAGFYQNTGDYGKAEQMHQRVLMIQEKVFGPNDYRVAVALDSLSSTYRSKKDYQQAINASERALRLKENLPGDNSFGVANTLNSLAILYYYIGDYAKAEMLFKHAVALWERIPGTEDTVAIALNNFANSCREAGDYAKAETLFLRALSVWEKKTGAGHYYEAYVLTGLAKLYSQTRDYAKAEPLFWRALTVLSKRFAPGHPEIIRAYNYLIRFYLLKGDATKATALQSQLNSVLEQNIALNVAVGSERQKVAYISSLPPYVDETISLHLHFAPNDATARDLAVTTILQRKGRVLDVMTDSFATLRRRLDPQNQALLDELSQTVAHLARVVLDQTQQFKTEEYWKVTGPLEEKKAKLEDEISRRSTDGRAQLQPVTLAAVKAAVPPAAALVEFGVYHPFDPKAGANQAAFGEPRYVAYVLRQQGEVHWKELGDAKAIEDSISTFSAALRDPKRRDVQRLARIVDERIMRPLRPLLGDATQLLISPDGALNLIPFEALVDEQDRYLVERFSLTYLTSGRDLLRMQVARTSKSQPVVLANPLFGEPQLIAMAKVGRPKPRHASLGGKRRSVTTGSDLSDVYFAPLDGTAAEAQTIKSLFAEARVLTGAQATESALKHSVAPRILHIATHGFFLTDSPSSLPNASGEITRANNARAKIENPLLRSGLALAGANLHNSGSDDDGILTALEASELNLWGTKLVTLSACDTGLGEVRNGEGVYGLRRAFVLAGTETLVMSLWPVSDYVTRELMTNYYTNLKNGLGRGEALRQVQVSMLKGKGREHPFYWASFIQSGEWANLDGKR